MKPRLVVMVKEPIPGRVKTRLGRGIGMVAAAHWYRKQTAATLRQLSDPRWDIVLAVSPDVAGITSKFWPPHMQRLPQGSGDLGMRMGRILRRSSTPKTCIIGSDIPNISRRHIWSAFAALGSHSGVLGPCEDGGYWLVGLRHPSRAPLGLFAQVRWSTQFAMEDTIRSARSIDWAQIDTLRDVDTIDDLKAF